MQGGNGLDYEAISSLESGYHSSHTEWCQIFKEQNLCCLVVFNKFLQKYIYS